MAERLCGLETEYAIRFSGSRKPDNREIYDSLVESLKRIIPVRPGSLFIKWNQVFLGSGGSLCYEMLPHKPGGGLVEAGTPETKDPAKLILYQRAQEWLLCKAIPGCERRLRRAGYSGRLSLIKNCRDSEGHIYGAQENYSATAAEGISLFFFRLFTTLFIPFLLVFGLFALTITVFAAVFHLAFLMFLALIVSLSGLIGLIFPPYKYSSIAVKLLETRNSYYYSSSSKVSGTEKWSGFFLYILELAVSYPVFLFVGIFSRLTLFRKHRRDMSAFLVSRIVLTGTGTLIGPGDFRLSEKAAAVNRIVRLSVLPSEHAIFDIGNIMKSMQLAVLRLLAFDFDDWKSLYNSNQRLQIGISDSNMSQSAEYLKVSLTLLVLEMCEDDFLNGSVKIPGPVKQMKNLNRLYIQNPQFKLTVIIDGKKSALTATELQKVYLEKAKKYLAERASVPIEMKTLLESWESTLNALEKNPAVLFGKTDWVTKRTLLQESEDLDFLSQKKIDIKYHELHSGYFQELEERGLGVRIFSKESVEQAAIFGPDEGRSAYRASILRSLREEKSPVTVSWDRIKIGGPFNQKVIDLNRFRRSRSENDSVH